MRPNALVLLSIAILSPLAAQTDGTRPLPPPVPYHLDSGPLANPELEPRTVFTEVVTIPGAPWLRLYFGEVVLGRGSVLRVTSLMDGEVQTLDAQALEMWSNTSAYFNGDSVRVELVAQAQTYENRLIIVQLAYEEPATPFTICQPDTRVLSNDPSAGRVEPIGCSGMVWGRHGCVISAGHCLDVASSASVIEFNVPPNHPTTCANQHPPVADQFPLGGHVFEVNGPGNDWGVARTFTNNLGQTQNERYGTFRPTALTIPPLGAPVTIWGYGSDTECLTDGAEQKSEGQITFMSQIQLSYDADTTGGSSGSGVTHDNEIIAVHTHGGCPQNSGTRVDATDFANARAAACIRAKGTIDLDREVYSCSDTAIVRVEDRSIAGAGFQEVTLTSDTETTPESVVLSEAYLSVFGGPGTIEDLPPGVGDGVLSVVHGDTITATYNDADVGTGLPGVATATATVDCAAPVILDVLVEMIDETTAAVSWNTDEPASSLVTLEGPGTPVIYFDATLVTEHAVVVDGLTLCTEYLFSVTSADLVNNTAVDDNSGALYPFDTFCPAPPPAPDGLGGGHGIIASLVSSTEIQVAWDNNCVSTGPAKLIHGPLEEVSGYQISGALCGIPAEAGSTTWTFPPGDQWFVLVKENGVGIEGSWGTGTAGERNGTSDSGQCDVVAKDFSGTCP